MKSVVQSIPAYVMNCFATPLSLCNEIEGMVNRFYWDGDVTQWKMNCIRWDKLVQPKSSGGLGFRSLLAKQWWRLMTRENSLLARTLKACYYRHSGSPSHLTCFSLILNCVDLVLSHCADILIGFMH